MLQEASRKKRNVSLLACRLLAPAKIPGFERLCLIGAAVGVVGYLFHSGGGMSKNAGVPAQGRGEESLMSPKAHGTTEAPPQANLRYSCDPATADKICCFNRHYAEHSGYFATTSWLAEVDQSVVTTYYDSVSGRPLFRAPIGRTFGEFKKESDAHGWPSFRDEEVVWENMRVLDNGESVSIDGTHLGHNLPDRSGNRYCINLVCVAGEPMEAEAEDAAAGGEEEEEEAEAAPAAEDGAAPGL